MLPWLIFRLYNELRNGGRGERREVRRGEAHHDATKVSSHAGIDTLFQAPFTTKMTPPNPRRSERD